MMAQLFHLLTPEDYSLASCLLGSANLREPDLIIAPDGEPYIYRWHVVPRNKLGNVYFHVQVLSDPERPLHDHPWDNTSVILAGGYIEHHQNEPARKLGFATTMVSTRRKGDVIHRKAGDAHRLELPPGVPYAMTLFTTGPNARDWGFWCSDHRGYPKWVSHHECIIDTPDGRSIFREPVL